MPRSRGEQGDSGADGIGTLSIGKTRGWLYFIARILGDGNAVKRGRVGRRIARRAAGRATGRGLGKLFK